MNCRKVRWSNKSVCLTDRLARVGDGIRHRQSPPCQGGDVRGADGWLVTTRSLRFSKRSAARFVGNHPVRSRTRWLRDILFIGRVHPSLKRRGVPFSSSHFRQDTALVLDSYFAAQPSVSATIGSSNPESRPLGRMKTLFESSGIAATLEQNLSHTPLVCR
jgi:hypothetical protein